MNVVWTKKLPTLAKLALFVVLFLIFSHYLRNLTYDSQRSALQQADMAQIQQRLDDLEARLLPERALFADASCEFGAFQPESNTVIMTLRFLPKASYAHIRDAIVRCNGTDLPLVLDGTSFTVSYPATVTELQNISSITFVDDATLQTVDLYWIIDPSVKLFPKLVTLSDLNTNGKTVSGLQYSGTLRSSVLCLPTNAGIILDAHLIELLDGAEQTRSAVKFPSQGGAFTPFSIEKK